MSMQPYQPYQPWPVRHPNATAILDAQVASYVHAGWSVESRTDTMAVMASGRAPNHVLHLLLSLITCGFWAFVWLIMAAVSRVKRVALLVNPNGTVTTTHH